MSKRRFKIPEPPALVRRGICLQIAGVVILSVTLFTMLPPVMIIALPLGAGLILLGWLAWAINRKR